MPFRIRKQAKILSDRQLDLLLDRVQRNEHAVRDRVMVLLSYRAGLRAGEIAHLSWDDLTDALGNLRTDYFSVTGKGARSRKVPFHPELYTALRKLKQLRRDMDFPMYAARGGVMTPNHVTVHLWQLYRAAGFEGASSHSGRRTLITTLSRRVNLFNCSIRDVQILAGHARLTTTQRYIEPSDQVSELVRSL